MNIERGIESNPQISEEAAEWLVEFRAGDMDSGRRSGFDAWLRASPEHLRAFIEMAALWHESGSIDPERRLRIEDLIVRAKAENNVIELDSGSSVRDGRPLHASAEPMRAVAARKVERLRRGRFRNPMLVAAAVLVCVVGAVLVTRMQLHRQPVYTTEVGEQRSIRLPDGSTVILDSRSQLRVAFDDSVRMAELLQGRALFRVTSNADRPFIVRADGTMVRTIGTQFDVNKNNGGTIVTVVEGRVAVYSGASASAHNSGSTSSEAVDRIAPGLPTVFSPQIRPVDEPATIVSAGEQLRVTAGQGSAQPTRANVSSATAWTQGQLVLESASLAEVAEAFSRYSSRKLVAEDHGATPLKLSGVFVTDPDFLIRYLRKREDITVRESNTEVEIVREASE